MKYLNANNALISMGFLIGLYLLIDFYFVIHGGIEATMSFALWSLEPTWPGIPFALGLLSGHLITIPIVARVLKK